MAVRRGDLLREGGEVRGADVRCGEVTGYGAPPSLIHPVRMPARFAPWMSQGCTGEPYLRKQFRRAHVGESLTHRGHVGQRFVDVEDDQAGTGLYSRLLRGRTGFLPAHGAGCSHTIPASR